MADIDHFKDVNDLYGHDGGDCVLKNMALHFEQTIRTQDMVGRWGGEEFVIVLPETDLEGGKAVAEKIRTNIENLNFSCVDDNLNLTITIGLVEYHGGASGAAYIKNADNALYRGKNQGRNQVVF